MKQELKQVSQQLKQVGQFDHLNTPPKTDIAELVALSSLVPLLISPYRTERLTHD